LEKRSSLFRLLVNDNGKKPFYIVDVSFAVAVGSSAADDDFFPLLMPKVKPTLVETYLCTPVRLNEFKTHYVIGFKPNATMHTAHHMLIYGCEEPGSDQVPTRRNFFSPALL
jgi:hypothetical protein